MRSWVLAAASEEWAGDEVLLLIVCGVLAVFGLVLWWQWLGTVPKLGGGAGVKLPLAGALMLAYTVMLVVTWYWSAKEIRHGQAYSWLVIAMGGASLTAGSGLFRWCGISVREDACERRNPAATAAVCGALVGLGLVYCGSITGEGPSFWNNVFSVGLGASAWFASWLALGVASPVIRSVTEDRDRAAGVRLGAFLLAQGLVLGRALAGDWHSMERTAMDLWRDGWPALVLTGIAMGVERRLKPTPMDATPSRIWGFPVAAAYVTGAAWWVQSLGWWEGVPW